MNTSLTFNNIKLNPVIINAQVWLSSKELSEALGYSSNKSVTDIFNKNKEEFTDRMSLVVDSTTNGIGNSKRKMKVRVFSLRGAHLIAMFSRTKIAKEFRKWVLDILDEEITPQCQPLTLTSEQKLNIRKAVGIKAKNDGESHKRIYSAIYNHFSISEYGDLLQEQYEEAIEFIQSLNITPRLPQSNQVPFYSTRVMLVIENGPDGQKVSQSPVPDDAFVVSKARIANLLNDPSLFTFDEMVQIAQVAQSRMVSLAKALPQALPNRD